MSKTTIPKEVKEWVASHKGSHTPRHMHGMFKSYSTSKMSMCWGQPKGGTGVGGGFKVAICQPSPGRKGDPAMFLFDYSDH